MQEMKKVLLAILALFTVTSFLSGCTNSKQSEPMANQNPNSVKAQSTEVTVSAAASLKDAMGELKTLYEAKKPGVKLVYNFGGSGALQNQIEQGAPVDLFISAGKSQMDALEKKQLLVNESRVNIVGNELVLIVGKDKNDVKGFSDLGKPQVKHIGIGEPSSVPAGKYAQQTLTSLKLWDSLQAKYVQAKDVRQVLSYVETGNAEAGLVYRSDTMVSDKVKIAAVAPESSHKPITYPAAVIKSSKNGAEAADFLKFLSSPEAKQIFVKYGFKDITK